MSAHEEKSRAHLLWASLTGSLSTKLLVLLISSMAVTFGVLGYLNIELHRKHLEQNALADGLRINGVIKRNTSYYMLRNQRDGLHHIIADLAQEPGMVRIRIINEHGRVSFSSDPSETNKIADRHLAAHDTTTKGAPNFQLANRAQGYETYRWGDGKRVLDVISPIENSVACSSAECHAHPANVDILGVLDTDISLETTEQSVKESKSQVLLYTILAVLGVALLSAAFVRQMIHDPLTALKEGTRHIGSGDLGYQIQVRQHGEMADLATSFNIMSCQLNQAQKEIKAWTHTLESRVEEKTRELSGAHEEMLRVERMASIGKLAAVVAHEINNPLAGILTYSKLLKKRLGHDAAANRENIAMLDLMESESRRCGEIVRNLMTFGRSTSMNCEPTDLNSILDRCVRLVQHQLELKNIELHLRLATDLPNVRCDPGQIEQVVLALVMNAIDAMANGGNLTLCTRKLPAPGEVQIEVRDDGVGMPPEVLANMFEPFFTTKERSRGLGLGLAISRNIVERHQGRIEVTSELGKGTIFQISLPTHANVATSNIPVGAPS
jgi:two-component system, NtrC family, sensor kinase